MRSLPEIKAMNAAAVDRNVTVHLRARQADIYEKALRKVIDAMGEGRAATTERELKTLQLADAALKRAEKLK